MEQNSMQRAAHPAHSPGPARSDFYLFGYVQQLPSGCQFAYQDSLLQAISDIWWALKNNLGKRLAQLNCANIVQSVGRTWSNETFYINRITDNTVGPEMLMGRWDALYNCPLESPRSNETPTTVIDH
jgi:hypothetical protein